MIKKFLSLLLILSMQLTSLTAFCDPLALPPSPALQPNETPVGQVISPMKMGQKAPFTGLLLSPQAVAQIIVNLNSQQAETDIQVTKAKETQKAVDQLIIDDKDAQITLIKSTTNVQIKDLDDEVNTLTKKLQDAEKSAPNLPLWIGVGAVGGIVLTVVTVFAVNTATK